jgi:hypothetical protein
VGEGEGEGGERNICNMNKNLIFFNVDPKVHVFIHISISCNELYINLKYYAQPTNIFGVILIFM